MVLNPPFSAILDFSDRLLGGSAFSKGVQEFDAWRASVASGLDYDERNKVEPYLREVFENVKKQLAEAPKKLPKPRPHLGNLPTPNSLSMNRNQRIVLIGGTIALLVMFLFPPWRLAGGRTFGYYFLFWPPARNIYIDFGRLFLQCLLVAILSSGIFLLVKSKTQ